MYTRLATAVVGGLALVAADARAGWILLDDFNGQGPIGGTNWQQTTPLQNFYMLGGRLMAAGKAEAAYLKYSELDQLIRFEAYSGETQAGVRDQSVQNVSALLGMQGPNDYYQIQLLADNLLTTDFYRMQFYSVMGGVATNDLTVSFASPLDAVRVEASLAGNEVTVSIQPFDRTSGGDIGDPLSYSFSSVPNGLATGVVSSSVGLGAQGTYVGIDNFEGFVVPESTTLLMAAMIGFVPWLRARRRR